MSKRWTLGAATLAICALSGPLTQATHDAPVPLFSNAEYLSETTVIGISDGFPVASVVAQFDTAPGLDMAVALRQSSSLAVLLNNGNGLYGEPQLYRTGSDPRHIAQGDVDGDGDNDLGRLELLG